MKKSCSAKESKVATTEDVENALNVTRRDCKEHLTEEQLLINQKLLESGIQEEGLDWLEKRNIFKTINVSLDTAGSERQQRSSPRLAKGTSPKPGKWVESSFENIKVEDFHNEKNPKPKASKKHSDLTATGKVNLFSSKRANQESEEPRAKIETSHCDKLPRDGETKTVVPKSGRKVCYIKIQLEENTKEECNLSAAGSNSNSSVEVSLGKKRASQPEIETLEAAKKLKMEETNNGVSSEEETTLKIELEMERRKLRTPFKIRDIKTIVSECEIRNKKWKETFLKYKCPARWGEPIVRTCSEKWDGKQIPPKLLHRYQKYLSSNNLTHPVFFPVKSQSNVDLNKLVGEISSQSSTNSECKEESENDFKHLDEVSFIQNDSASAGLENNLNACTSAKDTAGRMVLRNRSQQKTVISDDEEFSSDDSDDWSVKQKSSKKQKTNARNKKAAEQTNKQLVLKLERCTINRGNGNEGGRKNENKNDMGFDGSSAMSPNALNQSPVNLKSGPDPDTMVCPICSHRFKKQHIESHATECASKTYKD